MNNQNLLIYDSNILYKIFEELKDSLNFKIINISKDQLNNVNFADFDNYLILTLKKNIKIEHQFVFNNFPIKFSKLLEKINIEFLKQKFNEQSNIDVGFYKVNINSRDMVFGKKKLKLTEKEIDTIIYLSKNNRSVSINELQKEVWSYQIELETHTVETHIHRLRKKIKEKFNDNNLIISTKDGYQIKKKNKFAKDLFTKKYKPKIVKPKKGKGSFKRKKN